MFSTAGLRTSHCVNGCHPHITILQFYNFIIYNNDGIKLIKNVIYNLYDKIKKTPTIYYNINNETLHTI